MADPWDKLDSESDASYARFLCYRNLGHIRTLEKAYAVYQGKPLGSITPHQVSGAFRKDCAAYRWIERADAWDVANLQNGGRQAVAAFLAQIRATAVKCLETIAEPDFKPRTWPELVETLNVLGTLIPPETILAVSANPADAGAGTEHADGPVSDGPGGVCPGSAEDQVDPGTGADSSPVAGPPA